MALERERDQVLDVSRTLESLQVRQAEVAQAIRQLTAQKQSVKYQADAREVQDRVKRLEQAEALSEEIEALTKKMFALSSFRDFPVEKQADISRIETHYSTAELQLKRLQDRRETLLYQIEAQKLAGPAASTPVRTRSAVSVKSTGIDDAVFSRCAGGPAG